MSVSVVLVNAICSSINNLEIKSKLFLRHAAPAFVDIVVFSGDMQLNSFFQQSYFEIVHLYYRSIG